MAACQTLANLVIGPSLAATAGPSTSTFALSAAGNWAGYAFNLDLAKTLNALKVYASAVAGTLADGLLSADIYSDLNGVPNASLASSTTVTGGHPTAAGWVEFTGFSLALSAQTTYWIVIKNLNATPASNFPTMQWGGDNTWCSSGVGYNDKFSNWTKTTTTGVFGAGSNNARNTFGWRLAFSDATYYGVPISSISAEVAANCAFGKQEVGNLLTVPANANLNVRGVYANVIHVGTPGNLRFRLYNGTTLLATTLAMPVGNITTTGNGETFAGYFSALQNILGGVSLRMVLSDATAGDTNTTRYVPTLLTVDNDANSRALMPFDGTIQSTVTTDNTGAPPVFTNDNTKFYVMGLLLDTAGEFGTAGGSIENRGILTGGRM